MNDSLNSFPAPLEKEDERDEFPSFLCEMLGFPMRLYRKEKDLYLAEIYLENEVLSLPFRLELAGPPETVFEEDSNAFRCHRGTWPLVDSD